LGLTWGDFAVFAGDDCFFEGMGAHVPCFGLRIDEKGCSAEVADGIGAGGECEALADDVIAGLHVEQDQRQVDGGGTGAEGGGVFYAGLPGQVGFKAIYVGAEGGDPVGGEGVVDEFFFQVAHVGRGEKNTTGHIV
jgi:hypothetical protein